ncbi:MAG: acyl-CoA carboxylase subunit epsilon [Arthrobacter sp.]
MHPEPETEPGGAPAEQALLSVAKGDPTPEELAALTAVVLALGSGNAAAPAKPGARHWIRRQQLQLAPRPGPGSWKRSRG